jgi:cytidine deaminase
MDELEQSKIDEIIDLCDQMLEKSYCVYSRFAVASVLVTECGKMFTGKYRSSMKQQAYQKLSS